MLARWGMPHLRCRKVRLFINEQYVGLYLFMEAPDQEYVFARSFPTYDPTNFALYKVKTTSRGCGTYTEQMQQAFPSPPEPMEKFEFQRGTHRTKLEPTRVYGEAALNECFGKFGNMMTLGMGDTVRAWRQYDENCGKMLVEVGLIDRDLGGRSQDTEMMQFINEYMVHEEYAADGSTSCTKDCSKTGLDSAVDADDWLKNFALYAVTLTTDSPMFNGNNYLLAKTGDDKGWKIVQYDHNNAFQFIPLLCSCKNSPINWAITRPTCLGTDRYQLAAPFFQNEAHMQKYLDYSRKFLDEIFTNQDFLDQIKTHLEAQKSFVSDDPWWFGYDYDQEIKAPECNEMAESCPVLSFFRQRAAIIKEQLDALDAGTFPRMPDKVEPWEKCQDWRMTEPPSKPSSTPNTGESDLMIYSEQCPAQMKPCEDAKPCMSHTMGVCQKDGSFSVKECEPAAGCAPCYPNSRCGSLSDQPTTTASPVSTAGAVQVKGDTGSASGSSASHAPHISKHVLGTVALIFAVFLNM
jgi:hypothetical protein